MSYSPHNNNGILDFEMGNLLGKIGKGLTTITDYTIRKPSAFIGGAIGGKKGRAIGDKIGKFTGNVTKFGVAAGVAPAIAPVAVPALTAMGAKKMMGRKGGRTIKAGMKALHGHPKHHKHGSHRKHTRHKGGKPHCDNALAARVAAALVAKLGGPLDNANKLLKMAELQRTATYEHKALMSNAAFRKKVLSGITNMAARGNADCQRTIRVLVGR